MSSLTGIRRVAAVVLTVLSVALLGGQTGAVGPAAAAAFEGPSTRFLNGQRSFSPNGDKKSDQLTLRYQLDVDGPVRMRVGMRGTARKGFVPFFVGLGSQSAGEHTWTWDGRDPRGKIFPDGQYVIGLRTSQGRDEVFVDLDLKFEARVAVAERYGTPARQVQKVYPRSRVVRDGIRLRVEALREREVHHVVLRVRNTTGQVVVRRSLRSLGKDQEMTWEARDERGHPLPPGRYVASVSGVDRDGNSGVGKPLRMWVSRDRLEWREETRRFTAQETLLAPCSWSGTPECSFYLPCGEVTPSTRLTGALTHTTEPCAPDEVAEAASNHFVPVSSAVRGLHAIRVAFTGEPTIPETVAIGHLAAGGSASDRAASSSSGARTEWFEDPYAGSGLVGEPHGSHGGPRVPAGAFWRFWTDGPGSFDVATFTLDLRYLAVAR